MAHQAVAVAAAAAAAAAHPTASSLSCSSSSSSLSSSSPLSAPARWLAGWLAGRRAGRHSRGESTASQPVSQPFSQPAAAAPTTTASSRQTGRQADKRTGRRLQGTNMAAREASDASRRPPRRTVTPPTATTTATANTSAGGRSKKYTGGGGYQNIRLSDDETSDGAGSLDDRTRVDDDGDADDDDDHSYGRRGRRRGNEYRPARSSSTGPPPGARRPHQSDRSGSRGYVNDPNEPTREERQRRQHHQRSLSQQRRSVAVSSSVSRRRSYTDTSIPPLPPGWREFFDPRYQRSYFVDPGGRTSWTDPRASVVQIVDRDESGMPRYSVATTSRTGYTSVVDMYRGGDSIGRRGNNTVMTRRTDSTGSTSSSLGFSTLYRQLNEPVSATALTPQGYQAAYPYAPHQYGPPMGFGYPYSQQAMYGGYPQYQPNPYYQQQPPPMQQMPQQFARNPSLTQPFIAPRSDSRATSRVSDSPTIAASSDTLFRILYAQPPPSVGSDEWRNYPSSIKGGSSVGPDQSQWKGGLPSAADMKTGGFDGKPRPTTTATSRAPSRAGTAGATTAAAAAAGGGGKNAADTIGRGKKASKPYRACFCIPFRKRGSCVATTVALTVGLPLAVAALLVYFLVIPRLPDITVNPPTLSNTPGIAPVQTTGAAVSAASPANPAVLQINLVVSISVRSFGKLVDVPVSKVAVDGGLVDATGAGRALNTTAAGVAGGILLLHDALTQFSVPVTLTHVITTPAASLTALAAVDPGVAAVVAACGGGGGQLAMQYSVVATLDWIAWLGIRPRTGGEVRFSCPAGVGFTGLKF
ncbi:hypothetical protein DFJ73DRAFT_906161 [Zopfochytrium polystomum]|nr:hypothetical protein DFJ73DRAFT_906161 [Zopfochytrium polystomum]